MEDVNPNLQPFASQTASDVHQDNMVSAQSYSNMDEDNWLDVMRHKASKGDEVAIDNLTSWYASEASAKTAREYETNRNAHVVDTLMEQYKRNGLNPYWLLDSGAVGSLSYSSNSNKYSSTGYMNKAKLTEKYARDVSDSFLKIGSLVASAVMMYMMFL